MFEYRDLLLRPWLHTEYIQMELQNARLPQRLSRGFSFFRVHTYSWVITRCIYVYARIRLPGRTISPCAVAPEASALAPFPAHIPLMVLLYCGFSLAPLASCALIITALRHFYIYQGLSHPLPL